MSEVPLYKGARSERPLCETNMVSPVATCMVGKDLHVPSIHREVMCSVQGYLAHKKTLPPRTLQGAYA